MSCVLINLEMEIVIVLCHLIIFEQNLKPFFVLHDIFTYSVGGFCFLYPQNLRITYHLLLSQILVTQIVNTMNKIWRDFKIKQFCIIKCQEFIYLHYIIFPIILNCYSKRYRLCNLICSKCSRV